MPHSPPAGLVELQPGTGPRRTVSSAPARSRGRGKRGLHSRRQAVQPWADGFLPLGVSSAVSAVSDVRSQCAAIVACPMPATRLLSRPTRCASWRPVSCSPESSRRPRATRQGLCGSELLSDAWALLPAELTSRREDQRRGRLMVTRSAEDASYEGGRGRAEEGAFRALYFSPVAPFSSPRHPSSPPPTARSPRSVPGSVPLSPGCPAVPAASPPRRRAVPFRAPSRLPAEPAPCPRRR